MLRENSVKKRSVIARDMLCFMSKGGAWESQDDNVKKNGQGIYEDDKNGWTHEARGFVMTPESWTGPISSCRSIKSFSTELVEIARAFELDIPECRGFWLQVGCVDAQGDLIGVRDKLPSFPGWPSCSGLSISYTNTLLKSITLFTRSKFLEI